jgi:hypothetical protein
MCDTLIDPVCIIGHLISPVTSSVAGGILGSLAQAVNNGVIWVIKNTATWWIRIPSPDLATEPAVTRLQQWILPVTVAVAVAGLTAAGVRMAILRKANPLIDATGGLLTLAAATALGAVVPTLLLKAGDAWSTWVLQVSTGGQFTQRLTTILTLGGNAAPAVVVIFGIVAIVFSIVQAALMLFRDAALIILAGVLPLAAAGSIAPMTRTWIRKLGSWMLALIFYKPAAAAVYATAFTMIGSGGDLQTVLMGFVMLVLSVLALPALMKFFTWTTGAVAGSGGGGQLLGAAAVGAFALGAMPSSRGGGSAAQDQAAYMSSRLGSSSGGSPGSSPGGPSGAGSGPPRPGGWPAGPSGAAQGGPGSSARPAGAAPGSTAGTSPAAASTPAGATDSTAPTAGAATSAGSPSAAAGAGAASGAAAGAGPAGAAAATAAQAASTSAHLATGAMEPEGKE